MGLRKWWRGVRVTVLSRKMASLVFWVTSFVLMMQVALLCEAQTLRTAPAKAAPGEGRDAIVDQIVQPFLQDGCHVGLSAAIVRRREACVYNFGSSSLSTHPTPTRDSGYPLASVTNTFT